MVKKGIVKEVYEDHIRVQIYKKSSRAPEEIEIETKKKFDVGDFVCFEMNSSLMPDGWVLVYTLPIILFFAGYFVSDFFGLSEGTKTAVGLSSIAACSIAIKVFDTFSGKIFSHKNINAW